jgi:hypothetical protein
MAAVAVAAILAVPALAQGRPRRAPARLVVLILVIDLEVHAGRVPEDEVDIGSEQIGGAEEDLAFDGLAVGVEEVEREVQLIERQRLGVRQVHPRPQPVVMARQLGERLQEAIGDHREQRQLVGGAPAAPPLVAAEDLADAELLPQRPHDVDGPQRARPLELDLLAQGREFGRGLDAGLAHARDAAGRRSSASRCSASARPKL